MLRSNDAAIGRYGGRKVLLLEKLKIEKCVWWKRLRSNMWLFENIKIVTCCWEILNIENVVVGKYSHGERLLLGNFEIEHAVGKYEDRNMMSGHRKRCQTEL